MRGFSKCMAVIGGLISFLMMMHATAQAEIIQFGLSAIYFAIMAKTA